VVRTSLATEIRIAPTPWSPIPKICPSNRYSANDLHSQYEEWGVRYIYLFTITDNDIINVIVLPKRRKILLDTVLIMDIQKTPLWPPE
jgi:hypothetical protein